MKKKIILLTFVLLRSLSFFGQKEAQPVPEILLSTIAQANHGNSYITFPMDIGNIESLWFEGNIIPNFYIRESKNSRLMGVITPQIIIRMYQEESFPVRTPSYMPQVTLYYLLKTKQRANSLSAFAKLEHHSNGQENDFYLSDGSINLKNGNFATNFYELGLIKTNYNSRFRAVQFFETSVQIYPKKLTIEELYNKYSLCRWNSTFSIFKLPHNQEDRKKKDANISLKGQTTWMFGDIDGWNSWSLNRLNLTFTIFYHPRFLKDIGFFSQLYHGLDYYNIYFNHRISIIRFGIMTEKLRF